MALVIKPQFGPYVYSDNNAEVSRLDPMLSVRQIDTEVPRQNSAIAIDGHLTPRVFRIEGSIGKDGGFATRDDYQAALDAFFYAHREGHRAFYLTTDRYSMAQVESITKVSLEGLYWTPYEVQFKAPDPYLYGIVARSYLWADSNSSFELFNVGSAPAAPVYTLTIATGGVMNVTVTLTPWLGTGVSFTLVSGATALGVGDMVAVDTLNQTVTYTPNGGSASNAMLWWSGGNAWPPLAPGLVTMTVTRNPGNAVGLTSIQSTWYDRYL